MVSWLDDVEPLLYCTPLLSVLPRTRLLANNITAASTKPWNTQQVSHSHLASAHIVKAMVFKLFCSVTLKKMRFQLMRPHQRVLDMYKYYAPIGHQVFGQFTNIYSV